MQRVKRLVKHLYVDERGQLIAVLYGVGAVKVAGLEGGKLPVANLPSDVPLLAATGRLPKAELPMHCITRLLRLGDAAMRLVRTQNADGGWEWMDPDADPASGSSAVNTIGVTAKGVLAAQRNLRLTVLSSGVAAYNGILTNSQDPDPSVHRIRGPDISFLVELSEASGQPTYAQLARDRYAAALDEYGGGSAAGFAEYIRDARKGQDLPAAIAWDVNLYLQGALALDRYFRGGYEADAKAMAEVVYDSLYVPPIDFNLADQNQNEYWIGVTGAIEAFVTTGLHEVEAATLVRSLMTSQEADGHFVGVDDGSDLQTTAYAVLALAKADESAATLEAAVKGIDYLMAMQMANGGWEYERGTGTENTEVTSEAAQALDALLCRI